MANSNFKAKASDDMSPEGVNKKVLSASDDSDVEGHGFRKTVSATEELEAEGFRKGAKAADDSDVEGHGFRKTVSATEELEAEGFRKGAKAADDDDVEGHAKRVL